MAREFIGNSANVYLLPVVKGEGEEATQEYKVMAELILLTIEAEYVLDDKARIVKTHALDSARLHISLANLDKYITALGGLRDQMESVSQTHERRLADNQLTLPGV